MKLPVPITYIIIAVLCVIIFLQRSCTGDPVPDSSQKPSVKIDTVYSVKDTVIYRNVPVYKTIKPTLPLPAEFIPSKQPDTLKSQFNKLVDAHVVKNIYKDSIAIDSFGYVYITDTVQFNKLGKRTFTEKYKIPVVTKTVTEQAPPKRQLYIGGTIGINNVFTIDNASAGLLYKNKKDQIYSIHAGVDMNGQFVYSAGTYWKIKLRK